MRKSRTYSSRKFLWAWIVVYFILVSGGIFLLRDQWGYDDPFITYRYARNLSSGLGFVYNPGERILSTTTPLFTLMLAAISGFVNNIPKAANLIGVMSIAAGAVAIYDIAASHLSPIVGWTGLLLYPSSVLLLDTIGSETPLYIFLCLASFAFYYRGRIHLTAVVSALAVLTRPDGFLVPIILLADWVFIRRRPFPWKSFLLFGLIVIPWGAFAWSYFGSPIPVTLAAKQHQGAMSISRQFHNYFFSTITTQKIRWHHWFMAGLAAAGAFYLVCKEKKWGMFLSWPALYLISFTALGISGYFWYYAPLLPGALVFVGEGLTGIQEAAQNVSRRLNFYSIRSGDLSLKLWQAILILLAVFSLAGAVRASFKPDARYAIYRKAGIWLQKNTPSDAKVGALEIGIIGYFSDRPIVDFAGLAQPEVTADLDGNSTYNDSALFAVKKYRPDFIVINQGSLLVLEQFYLHHNCNLIKQFPGSQYGFKTNLNIFACPNP